MDFLKTMTNKFFSILGIQIIKKRTRNFDQIVIELFELLDRQPKVVFDVGAHNGSSIMRYLKLSQSSLIFSFEPNLEMYNEIKAKFTDQRVRIFNIALAEKLGIAEFNIHKTSTGSSSLLQFKTDTKFSKKRYLLNNVEKIKVETTALDLVTRQLGLSNIDILKIDTQGTEFEVLKGAKNLLQQQAIDLIELEIIVAEVYDQQHNWSEIISYLAGLNYYLIALSNDGRFYNLGPFDLLMNPELQFDCIFVNKDVYTKLQKVINK